MADPRFFDNCGPFTLGGLAAKLGAELADASDAGFEVRDVANAQSAASGELCYALTPSYLAMVKPGRTVPVIVKLSLLERAVEAGILAILHADPVAAFATAAHILYPGAARTIGPLGGVAIDPTARLAKGVTIESGAVVGPNAMIGEGTHIAANAVVGRGVCVGRDCFVGPCASVSHTLLGDRVILHAGVRIGTDGFGYASGAAGHRKIPQLGRVIVQDDVEIGANTCIDRGALGDTTIGEGTKIDNLVQIGHNNSIGRHVVIASAVGMSGSVTVGDWSAMGGQVGIADHVTIGKASRIAGKTGVTKDLAGGRDYAGFPARPAGEWRREVALLRRMAKGQKRRDD